MKLFQSLDRTESLKRMIPGLFDMSCLYIGARGDRIDYFRDFNKQPTVLEAWEPNVVDLNSKGIVAIHEDVRKIKPTTFWGWEVVFWWHGPEHIKKKALKKTLRKLERIASKAVVLGCPWRYFEQPAIGDNPYEEHLSHLDYEDFEELGYEVECLGYIDQRGSNITAVKYV